MNYDVTLRITYDYPAAVKDARHILRVRPRATARQAVPAVALRIAPEPDEAVVERDFFGNPVDHVRLQAAHSRLDVEMRARVACDAAAVDLAATPDAATLRRQTRSLAIDADAPAHFLGTSRLLRPSREAADFARPLLAAAAHRGAGTAVLALTQHIRETFRYAPGATGIDTSVAEILETRHGVCQDFAHLLIAALRSHGYAAGYVSGFLRTDPPPGRPRLEGADAMHAWARVWLGPETGWVGFDPTNGTTCGLDHIEVAVGRDYADVAPIGGVVVTSGPQRTRHSVDVVPVKSSQS